MVICGLQLGDSEAGIRQVHVQLLKMHIPGINASIYAIIK